MSTTKLGAKAANNLREKRRVGARPQSDMSGNDMSTSYNDTSTSTDDAHASDILEVSMTESQASGTSNRSNVYSFFDPADIRKPPTSPVSATNTRMRVQPFDEPLHSTEALSSGGGDDTASRTGSVGSAATERIGNHKSSASVPPSLAASAVRPSSSTLIMEEREVKYEEGATELFMLVEDAKWEEVCDR